MQATPITPLPARIEQQPGSYVLPRQLTIAHDAQLGNEAELLAERLGIVLPRSPLIYSGAAQAGITLEIQDGQAPEGYELAIRSDGIAIRASSPAGIFFGCQSLFQLVQASVASAVAGAPIELQAIVIKDQPRFPWRGLMLDVARHFYTADEVCRLLDLMSLYKFNRFHWHLTDDQGWRFPVKRYPRLTEVGSVRACTVVGHSDARPRRYNSESYGGHYTADDIRRVVAYAARRHITIVPEIDMPGHMQAAIAAYPELGNLASGVEVRCHWGISQHILNPQQSTVEFMQHVLEEVMELFPGKFIHIGGDEAHTHEWGESRAAQDRMAELGLKSDAALQSWFISQMGRFLAAHGRRMIGWDEILEGDLPRDAAIMSWRGMKAGTDAASAGRDVVMTPHTHTYFDHFQTDPHGQPLAIGGLTPVEKVYGFEPLPDDIAPPFRPHVLGAQGQLWTEYIPTLTQLEYMAFPRAIALAEVVWSPPQSRNGENFAARLDAQRQLLATFKVHHGLIPESAAMEGFDRHAIAG